MKKRIKRILLAILLVIVVIGGVMLYKTLHNSNTILGSIYKFKQDYDHKNDYDLSGVEGVQILFSVPQSSDYEKNPRTLKDFNPSKFDDVQKYEGRIYGLYNDNGPYYEFDDYGNLNCEGTLKNGEKDGVGYCYYSDGSIEYVFNYKNGKRDGISIEYDLDNEVRTVEYFKDGKLDGEYIQRDYFDGGILNGYYDNNKRKGTRTGYKADGSIEYLSIYNEDGEEIGYKQYYDYNKEQLEYVKLFDDEGEQLENIAYYENGQIKRIEKYGDSMYGYGIISSEYYDENGNKLDKDPDDWWD